MYRYAQIDDNNIVVSDSWLSGEVVADNMISIPDDMESPLGKKYENGEFINVEHPEPQDEPIDQQELLESMAIDLEYLVTLKNMEGGE